MDFWILGRWIGDECAFTNRNRPPPQKGSEPEKSRISPPSPHKKKQPGSNIYTYNCIHNMHIDIYSTCFQTFIYIYTVYSLYIYIHTYHLHPTSVIPFACLVWVKMWFHHVPLCRSKASIGCRTLCALG